MQGQGLPVIRTSVCKGSEKIRSKLFTESSAVILCVLLNSSKPCIIFFLKSTPWIRLKSWAVPLTEENQIPVVRAAQVIAPSPAQSPYYASVQLTVRQSFYSIRKGRYTGNDASRSLFKRISGQPEERREVRKIQGLLVIAVYLLQFSYSVTFGNDTIKLRG